MKSFLYSLFIILVIASCSPKSSKSLNLSNYSQYGDKELVTDKLPMTKEAAFKTYEALQEGEKKPIRFQSTINSVCVKKGCWMRLDLGNKQEAFIKFKDYAFFVPKDVAGKTVIVDGTAELKVTSVERLRHYAQDAGKSQEEIDKITEPEKTYFFLASNVLIQKD